MAPPKGFIPWNKGLKGIHLSPATEIKKGQHLSPKTQFKKGHKPKKPIKKGERRGIKTEFRDGHKSWNKGKQYPQIQWDKHWSFTTGKGSYAKRMARIKDPICEMCAFNGIWRKTIQVHHKDKNRDNNDLNNLQILCTKCHANIHKNWLLRKKIKKSIV